MKRFGLHPVVGDLYRKENESYSNEKDSEGWEIHVVADPDTIDISQVVLPLPGYNIQYPSNEIGELYKELLDADGVNLTEKDSIPESTAKGSYRKLIQHAHGLKWHDVSKRVSEKPDTSDDAVVDAACFTFELESGCYATMMLRELMVTTMARDSKVKDKS